MATISAAVATTSGSGAATFRQPPCISLLTPEYQKRMVQMNYHEAVSNAPQWMASFCYPEGFMRWWAEASLGGPIEVMMNPNQVQFLTGIADNLLRRVLIGRQHVQKVPQWFGETVGFWNGNTLVAWTTNVQGWTLSHSMFEFSNQMQVDRDVHAVCRRKDASTSKRRSTIRKRSCGRCAAVTPWQKTLPLNDANQRFTYVECRVQSTIVNGPDGRPTQLTFVDPGIHRLFRASVGAELGRALREGLEEAVTKPSLLAGLVITACRSCARASLVCDVRHDADEERHRQADSVHSRREPCPAALRSAGRRGKMVVKNGKPSVMGVETGSAANFAPGVTVDEFPIGTIITVALHPLRDGKPLGALAGELIRCGTTWPKGGCTKATGQMFLTGSSQ